MQGTIDQATLKHGLAIASKAVAQKSTLPILSHYCLSEDNGQLLIRATNLEIGISVWLPARFEEGGAITAPGKLLDDVIGAYPAGLVVFSTDDRSVSTTFVAGRQNSTIKGMSADEFPVIPTVVGASVVGIPSRLLGQLITQTVYAAADDDTRPILTGVHLLITERQVMLETADGFRAARAIADLPDGWPRVEVPVNLTIGGRGLGELGAILNAAKESVEVSIGVSQNGGQVIFEAAGLGDVARIALVSRVIEGTFPEISRIIPAGYETRTVVSRADLRAAVKLASFFANAGGHIVRLSLVPGGDLAPGTIRIMSNAAEIGDQKAELDAMLHGDGGQVALNVHFLGEVLGLITTGEVAIETQAGMAPPVLRPVGSAVDVLHLIMPMTVK